MTNMSENKNSTKMLTITVERTVRTTLTVPSTQEECDKMLDAGCVTEEIWYKMRDALDREQDNIEYDYEVLDECDRVVVPWI